MLKKPKNKLKNQNSLTKKIIIIILITNLTKSDFDDDDDYKIGALHKNLNILHKNHIQIDKTIKTNHENDSFTSMFSKMKAKNIENSFKKRINAIRIENWDNKETITAIDELEQIFLKNYKKFKPKITSKKSTMSLNDNLSAFAKAHKYDKSLGAHTYGVKTGKNFTKILISGARGKKKKSYKKGSKAEISTLGLAEIIEMHQTGITAAFASQKESDEYFIDAKVNEESAKVLLNKKGQLEISKSLGKKYLIHSSKSALGVTKIFRMLFGTDYVKLIVSFLVSGASVKQNSVLSKSSVTVKVYLTYDQKLFQGSIYNKAILVKKNLGYFSSENKTNYKRSVSKHLGYLMIQKPHGNSKQSVYGEAQAEEGKGTKVEVKRTAVKRSVGHKHKDFKK